MPPLGANGKNNTKLSVSDLVAQDVAQ